jgi:hypothetical protein
MPCNLRICAHARRRRRGRRRRGRVRREAYMCKQLGLWTADLSQPGRHARRCRGGSRSGWVTLAWRSAAAACLAWGKTVSPPQPGGMLFRYKIIEAYRRFCALCVSTCSPLGSPGARHARWSAVGSSSEESVLASVCAVARLKTGLVSAPSRPPAIRDTRCSNAVRAPREPLVLWRYAVPELPTRKFAAPHREQNVALAVVHKGRKRVDRAP